jgi:hypothetical protein
MATKKKRPPAKKKPASARQRTTWQNTQVGQTVCHGGSVMIVRHVNAGYAFLSPADAAHLVTHKMDSTGAVTKL